VRPRLSYTIPDNVDPLVAVVTDTEVSGVGASVTYKLPVLRTRTAGDYREALTRNVLQSVLAQRYRELTQTSDPPFLGAGAGYGGLTEGQGAFTVSVVTSGGGLIRGMNASLSEVERMAQFGALDSELERVRTALRASVAASYAERGDATSGAYAEAYRESFLSGDPVIDIVTNVGLMQQLLPTITNADLERAAAVWRNTSNRIVIAQLPKSLDIIVPDTSSLLASFEYPLRYKPTPYVELAHDDLLIPTPPTPGTIVTRESLPNDITQWTLSNGIRVLLRPSTNTADQVYVTAYSPGGYNLDLDKGLIPAQTAAEVIAAGGMGKFSLIELEKRLTGHLVHFGVHLDGMSEGIEAAAITNDMETMFQLIYLGTTQPRLDSTAVATLQRESRASLENRNGSPLQQFQDTVTLTMAQHNPWVQLPSVAQIDSIDPVKSMEVYRDRFRDMSDFRFVIVGHFSLDSIAPLVERYLASLPGGGRVETPKDLGIRPPAGMVHKTVAAETEPKATTYMSFYGPLDMTPENEWNLYALVEILRLRLLDRLRQQLGGTYTPSVQLNTSEVPYPNYSITIGFITSPERDEELAKATLAVLDSMQHYPATDEEVAKVKEAQRRYLEEARKQDGYWAQKIARFDFLHRSFALIGSEDVAKNWTAADVQRAARQFFHLDAYARFDLVPGTHASASASANASANGNVDVDANTNATANGHVVDASTSSGTH
jgi:zinc protease